MTLRESLFLPQTQDSDEVLLAKILRRFSVIADLPEQPPSWPYPGDTKNVLLAKIANTVALIAGETGALNISLPGDSENNLLAKIARSTGTL